MSRLTITGTFRAVCAAPLVLALTLLAGCGAHFDALSAPPVAIKGANPNHRTAVVASIVGEKLAVKKVGVMVFGNSLDLPSIETWMLDAHITSRIAAHLGKSVQTRRVVASKEALAEFSKPGGGFADQEAQLQTFLKSLQGLQQSDLIVVVMGSTNQIANTNQYVSGLGILSLPGLFSRKLMHAVIQIRVYDGKTYKPLVTRLTIKRDYRPLMEPIRGPHREIEDSWWPADPAKVADDTRLRSAMIELLDDTLVRTLPEALAIN